MSNNNTNENQNDTSGIPIECIIPQSFDELSRMYRTLHVSYSELHKRYEEAIPSLETIPKMVTALRQSDTIQKDLIRENKRFQTIVGKAKQQAQSLERKLGHDVQDEDDATIDEGSILLESLRNVIISYDDKYIESINKPIDELCIQRLNESLNIYQNNSDNENQTFKKEIESLTKMLCSFSENLRDSDKDDYQQLLRHHIKSLIDNEIQLIQNQLDESKQVIISYENSIKILNEALEKDKLSLISSNEQIDKLTNDMNTLHHENEVKVSSIQELEKQLLELKSNLENEKSYIEDIAVLKLRIISLENDLELKTNQKNQLEDTLISSNLTIENMQIELTKLTNDISLKSHLIEKLESEMNSLEEKIQLLEGKLELERIAYEDKLQSLNESNQYLTSNTNELKEQQDNLIDSLKKQILELESNLQEKGFYIKELEEKKDELVLNINTKSSNEEILHQQIEICKKSIELKVSEIQNIEFEFSKTLEEKMNLNKVFEEFQMKSNEELNHRNNEIIKLESQLMNTTKDSSSQLANYQNELIQVKESYDKLVIESKQLNERLDQRNDVIQDLNDKVLEVNKQIEVKEVEFKEELGKQMQSLKHLETSYEEKIQLIQSNESNVKQEIRQQVNELQDKLSKCELDLGNEKMNNASLSKQLEDLSTSLVSSQANVNDLNVKIQEMKKAEVDYQQDVIELTNNLNVERLAKDEWHKKHDDCLAKNNSLISQLEEVERSFQQNHILTNELKKLNQDLQTIIQQTQDENEELRGRLEIKTEEYNIISKKYLVPQQEVACQYDFNVEYISELEASKQLISDLEADVRGLMQKTNELQVDKEQSNKFFETFKQKVDLAQEASKVKMKYLNDRIIELENISERFHSELQNVLVISKQLEVDNNELRQKLEEYSPETMDSYLEKMKTIIETYKIRVKELNETIESLRYQNQSLNEQYNTLNDKYYKLITELQDVREVSVNQEQEVHHLRQQVVELETTMHKYANRFEQLNNQIFQSQNDIQLVCRLRPIPSSHTNSGIGNGNGIGNDNGISNGNDNGIGIGNGNRNGISNGNDIGNTNTNTDTSCYHVSMNTLEIQGKSFDADKIYLPIDSQDHVFQDFEPTFMSILQGCRTCCLCYGSTGSGKSYTILGSDGEDGLFHRVCLAYLTSATNDSQVIKTSIYISMMDMSIDGLMYDLLLRGTILEGDHVLDRLQKQSIMSLADITSCLQEGLRNRQNQEKSYLFIKISVQRHHYLTGHATLGSLLFAELIGSEKPPLIESSINSMKAIQSVQRTFQTLSDVIQAIMKTNANPLKTYQGSATRWIPYRNSRLTFQLQHFMQPGCKIIVICHLIPSIDTNMLHESMSTMHFLNRCRYEPNLLSDRNEITSTDDI